MTRLWASRADMPRVCVLQFSLELNTIHRRTHEHHPRLFEYTLDLETGEASSRLVHEDVFGDFPVIAPNLAGATSPKP